MRGRSVSLSITLVDFRPPSIFSRMQDKNRQKLVWIPMWEKHASIADRVDTVVSGYLFGKEKSGRRWWRPVRTAGSRRETRELRVVLVVVSENTG